MTCDEKNVTRHMSHVTFIHFSCSLLCLWNSFNIKQRNITL